MLQKLVVHQHGTLNLRTLLQWGATLPLSAATLQHTSLKVSTLNPDARLA
jgi:hypothetical protein